MNTNDADELFSDFNQGAPGVSLISLSDIAYAKKIVSSKKESIAFLKRAGILNDNGELAEPYR